MIKVSEFQGPKVLNHRRENSCLTLHYLYIEVFCFLALRPYENNFLSVYLLCRKILNLSVRFFVRSVIATNNCQRVYALKDHVHMFLSVEIICFLPSSSNVPKNTVLDIRFGEGHRLSPRRVLRSEGKGTNVCLRFFAHLLFEYVNECIVFKIVRHMLLFLNFLLNGNYLYYLMEICHSIKFRSVICSCTRTFRKRHGCRR